jgi:hypothetical protein
VHGFAEAKLGGLPLPEPTDERDAGAFKAVAEFIDKDLVKKYKVVAMEKIIFAPDLKLAGMVDLLVKDKTGQLWFMDWKSNKAIKYDNGYQKGIGSLSHLDDCNFAHYSLQLNLYRRLLQREGYYRNAEASPMQLLHIKPLPRHVVQAIRVEKMDAEIDYLFSLRCEI